MHYPRLFAVTLTLLVTVVLAARAATFDLSSCMKIIGKPCADLQLLQVAYG